MAHRYTTPSPARRWPSAACAGLRLRSPSRAGAGRRHRHHHRPQPGPRRRRPASATCRWPARRCRPACSASEQLADAGVASIGGLTRLDASLGDAYNADGYWSILSSRGYTLDNRSNYRRDGLPINAETAIALDNKERLELLKGTSGIQAGTSAPGGLVDLVVKRPTGTVREARFEAREPGSAAGRGGPGPSASAPTAPSACG